MPMDLKDRETKKNKQFITSLEFAIQGIRTAFKEERNMRTHAFMGIAAIIIGVLCQLAISEWLWLLLAILLVFVVEIINTVFENVVDLVTDYHFHPIGKKIKDMAAGAVLITTGFAVVVGLLLFVPKIWQLLIDFL